MSKEGRTGLVIPVPEADALVESVADGHPGAVREGVPAHVSVLYPFVPAAELDEAVISALAEVFGDQPPLPVTFETCHRRDGFVFLRPEPVDGLAELTARTRRRWPDIVPYEGVYGEVEPHLTVAMKQSPETAAAIERESGERLPISAELGEAWLVTFTGQWSVHTRFVFERTRS